MRMWMVAPSSMCRRHLLGEHVEIHMLVGTLNRGTSISGFLSNDLVEPQEVVQRHAELAAEMVRRGYNHASPLPSLSAVPVRHSIDRAAADAELRRRCPDCAKRANSQLQSLQTNKQN